MDHQGRQEDGKGPASLKVIGLSPVEVQVAAWQKEGMTLEAVILEVL